MDICGRISYADFTEAFETELTGVAAAAGQSFRGRIVAGMGQCIIDPQLQAAADDDARTVVLTVADTGHGIDAADMGHIFEPFYTTKKEGSGVGLGLSTSFGIVERHGGTLSLESRKGQGTTFTLRLPMLADEKEACG